MINLETTYMGLTLKNPVVVSSSGLTNSVRKIKILEEKGAGAVVLKSLFEEQITNEASHLISADPKNVAYPEAEDYIFNYVKGNSISNYLDLIREAKKSVSIPVIASINCVSAKDWTSFAKEIENAGADAIELNVGLMPTLANQEGPSIVDAHLRILHDVKTRAKIPVAMKVGPYFTSFANFADRLTQDRAEAPAYSVGWFGRNKEAGKVTWKGVDGLVIFNRFYKFDIDIDKMELVHGNPYSTQQEIHYTLRWLSLLTGKVPCDMAASTGIHTGRDAVKAILAGAKVVQLCSTLYTNGLGQLEKMKQEMEEWMAVKNHHKLCDFRGKMSQIQSDNPSDYERLQYIKLFVGID